MAEESDLASSTVRTAAERWVLPAVLVVVAIAYLPALQAGWFFDDTYYVLTNASTNALWPPYYLLGNSRPLVFLSFAIETTLFGKVPFWFHLTNLLIHLAAVATLYALLREVLAALPSRTSSVRLFENRAAAVAALLWGLHPLGTMAVAYVWQRGESLSALFCLLAMFLHLKSRAAADAFRWQALTILVIVLGMLTKETAAIIPVGLLLLDLVLLRLPWRRALMTARRVYAGSLLAIGMMLILLSVSAESFHGHPSFGFREGGTPLLSWLLTVPGVILHYLRLALWPRPLLVDYRWPLVTDWTQAVLPGLVVLTALAATLAGIARRRVWALAPAGFFLALAPTTSLLPMPDPIFEYRMYLPLAFLVSLAVAGAGRLAVVASVPQRRRTAGVVALLLALSYGWMTLERAQQYQSPLLLWSQVLEVYPENSRAHNNLGLKAAELAIQKQDIDLLASAVVAVTRGLELESDRASNFMLRARLYLDLYEPAKALDDLRSAERVGYTTPLLLALFSEAYLDLGNMPQAVYYGRRALTLDPHDRDVIRACRELDAAFLKAKGAAAPAATDAAP